MTPTPTFPSRAFPSLVLLLGLAHVGCSGDDAKNDDGADRSPFAGLWVQTHQASDGTCFGPLNTDGQFVLRIRDSGGDLEVVTLDQNELSRELCAEPLTASGGVASVDGNHFCVVPAGATDPIMLEPATSEVVIRFTVDRYEVSGETLHETFEATHDDGTTECTFNGEADYTK